VPYNWTLEAGEYATDFAFRSADDLARIYPLLVEHARTILQSTDLLRFLGYRVRNDGKPWGNMVGEVTTRIKELVEGICVKHQVLNNDLKMYDKFNVVVRLEALLRNLHHFKVYRASENDPEGPKDHLRMRQGVADLSARAEASQEINSRYAASLATVVDKTPLGELTKDLGKRTFWKGRTVRALNPLAIEDVRLLQAVSRGEFLISGFRNRDIRAILFSELPATAAKAKAQAANVTRLLRLLRAHGLIDKIAKSHRYQVTEKGAATLSALLAARKADTKQLLQAA
jgi:LmbE family N-acetylglucosaminyl deacetylase